MEVFRRIDRVTLNVANDFAVVDKSYSVVAQNYVMCMADCRLKDCNKVQLASVGFVCMDGCYSDCYTSAGAVDSDDVMRKLVAKAVRE